MLIRLKEKMQVQSSLDEPYLGSTRPVTDVFFSFFSFLFSLGFN